MRERVRSPLIDPLHLTDLEEAEWTALTRGASLEGVRVSSGNIDGRDLADLSTSECRLENLSLRDTSLLRARFSETQIVRLDVAALEAAHSSWRFCELEGCRVGSAELFDSAWQSVRLRECKLGYLNLRGAELNDVEFVDCRIDELDLQGAKIRRLAFSGCELNTIVLRQAALHDVDLRGATLAEIQGVDNLRGVIVSAEQLVELAPLLASHLGITVA